MDLSVLRRTRLVLAACTLEYVVAIALGFLWADFGFPPWQGEVLIGLGVVGAAGFVAFLPRVEFVSDVASIRLAPSEVDIGGAIADRAASAEPVYEVWAVEARTRNWEMLGDRGGRRVVRVGPSPRADVGAQQLAEALVEGGAPR
jgi:hypothetical protein